MDYDERAIEIYRKNNTVIMLNKNNLCWVRLEESSFKAYMKKKQEFYKYIDEKFHFFKQECRKKHKIHTVYFSVTRCCNLACSFCSMKSNPEISMENDVSLESIRCNVLPKLLVINPDIIIITGGEPLKRTDCTLILKSIKDYGIKSFICLQTNGLLLTKEIINELEGYVDAIEISIENIFVDMSLLNKMKNIFNMIRAANISLRFSFVISQNSRQYIQAAVDLCVEYQAFINLRLVSELGNAVNKDIFLSLKDCISIYKNLTQHIIENEYYDKNIIASIFTVLSFRRSCAGYGNTLGIHPEGDVFMCGNFYDNLFTYGNIVELSVDELYQNIDKKINSDVIKNFFLVEQKPLCNKCIYKFFCGGLCAAEMYALEKEKKVINKCGIREIISEFIFFYYKPNREARENLLQLYQFLLSKEKEISDEK